jgi:hypothetical protein
MRVFVAGATGAIGRPLISALIAAIPTLISLAPSYLASRRILARFGHTETVHLSRSHCMKKVSVSKKMEQWHRLCASA